MVTIWRAALLLLPLLVAVVTAYEPTMSNCSAPPYWVAPDGRDIMEENRGIVTMVYLLRFDCPGGKPCTRLLAGLRKFDEMITDNRERYRNPTNYIIVAPPSDRRGIVEYWARSLKRDAEQPRGETTAPTNKIEVIQDDREGRIWKVLGGKEYDMFVYDRCGRQAFYVPYPQSSFEYHYPVSVIHKAHIGDPPPCGPCPPGGLNRRFSPEFPTKEQPSMSGTTQKPPPSRIRVFFANFEAKLRRTGKTDNSVEVIAKAADKKGTGEGVETEESTIAPGQVSSSAISVTQDSSTEYYVAAASTKKPTTVVLPGGSSPSSTLDDGLEKMKQIDSVEGAVTSSSEADGTEVGAGSTQTTTDLPPVATTTQPYTYHIPGVDCSGFSDHKCWAAQSDGEELHPCCYKGVYITDVCKEPLCSEDTYNLCCFQRMQQARYRCCQNTSVTCKKPDEFSRCCYNFFTDDVDSCCPSDVAKAHWSGTSRVVEYCQPNIVADWDDVLKYTVDGEQLEVHLSEVNGMAYRCNHFDRFPSCKPYYYIPFLPVDES